MILFQNSLLTSDEEKNIQKLSLYFTGNYENIFTSFLADVFPGFLPSDPLNYLAPLLSSRNPNLTLSNLAVSSFTFSCDNATSNVTATQSCDEGFLWDQLNGFCYKVLDEVENYWSAAESCHTIGAQLVGFDNDLEVKGFISLFNNRNIFILFKEIE
jgi:hypothetical protein